MCVLKGLTNPITHLHFASTFESWKFPEETCQKKFYSCHDLVTMFIIGIMISKTRLIFMLALNGSNYKVLHKLYF